MSLGQRPLTFLFALTLFVSAALLFSIQPLVAKLLLPLLGGTPGVWNICILFFQAVLLAGYGYAFIVSKRSSQWQVLLQLMVLAIALFCLPVGLSESWINSVPASGNPSLWLLGCLSAIIGLPFFILASNGPLLQKWFAQSGTASGRDPYFLYSASNAGSFVALLSYPVLLEPNFKLRSQALIWMAGYVLLLFLVGLCGLSLWSFQRSKEAKAQRAHPAADESTDDTVLSPAEKSDELISVKRRVKWILLAFVPSSLMLGVTNYISTDIASVPLLWIIPLALYLLTFVLAFARRRLIPLSLLIVLLPVGTMLVLIGSLLEDVNTKLMIAGNLVYFAIAALTCHQQLAEDRPSTAHLTQFYFWLSLGGVMGGLFNALLAPAMFTSVAEYPLIILFACLLLPLLEGKGSRQTRWMDYLIPAGVLIVTVSLGLGLNSLSHSGPARMLIAIAAPTFFLFRKRPVRFVFCAAALMFGAGIVNAVSDNILHAERNFFGVLRVGSDAGRTVHWLFHGSTTHGRQSTLPDRRCEALSYYHRSGPLGQVFASFQSSPAIKDVAIIGLGTGATAVYALPGERWTFYEINPAVIDIARNPEYFTYLSECSRVPMNIVLGDARLKIRDAPDAGYGIIVLDAFSSDAIPLHLITQEALDLYLSKLGPGGLLVFHISNRHLDLSPVMADLAGSRNLQCIGLYDSAPFQIDGRDTSVWVVMARERSDIATISKSAYARTLQPDDRRVWTDDFSNILSVFRWR